jgi:hypothetical protein
MIMGFNHGTRTVTVTGIVSCGRHPSHGGSETVPGRRGRVTQWPPWRHQVRVERIGPTGGGPARIARMRAGWRRVGRAPASHWQVTLRPGTKTELELEDTEKDDRGSGAGRNTQ